MLVVTRRTECQKRISTTVGRRRTFEPMIDETARGRSVARLSWRRYGAFLVGALVVAALALPALAADPSASPSADPSASPAASIGPSASASAEPAASSEPSATTEPSASSSQEPSVAPVATPPRSVPTASSEPTETDEDADQDEDSDSGKPDKANKGNKGDKTPEVAITLHGTVATAKDAKGRPTFSLTSGGTTYELEAGPPWFWADNNPLAKFTGKTVTIAGETHTGSTEVDVQTVDGTAIRAPGKPPWAGGWKVVGEKHPGWSQAKADKFKAKFGGCFPPGQCKRDEATPPVPAGVPGGD
jgi:outer membrane biosynthesis protein TonB